MHRGKCIFLIGFMASGKSTIGSVLSRKLNCPFWDVDSEVEKHEGVPIHEIFERYGEPYFRKREILILRDLVSRYVNKPAVISAGGGLPCDVDNFAYMKENGIIVYLKSSIDDIISRVEQSRERPVFHRIGTREGLENLFAERQIYYDQADLIIENPNSIPPEDTAAHIARTVQHFYNKKQR